MADLDRSSTDEGRPHEGRPDDGRPDDGCPDDDRAAGGPTGPGAAELTQHFDHAGLRALRSAVGAHAARLGLAQFAVDNMVLVAHELAANVVRHAGGAGRLRLWGTDGFVYCEVSDAGPGIPDPDAVGTSRPAPQSSGGRGLWLVRQICARVTVRTGPGGTTITVALPLS
jgi:anti-sigma regulatory factor (Ser/Thr protein kinase)